MFLCTSGCPGTLSINQADLELIEIHLSLVFLELFLKTRLDLSSQKHTCICLPNTGVKGVKHYSQIFVLIF